MRASVVVFCCTLLCLWTLGCGSSPASGPVVTVSPATLTVTTGDAATTFAAILSNGAVGPVMWSLSGPGSISPTSGDQTAYQPPALGGSGGTAMLRATAGCGTGCGPIGTTATITVNTATSGNLTITVSGLPSVAPASLTVTGPNSYSQKVSTATMMTLTGLAPGAYTVTGADIIDSNPIVNGKWTAPPAPATVVANRAVPVTVAYASLPGYGRLWVANGAALDGFTPGDLQVNRSPSLTPTTAAAVQGIAFDSTGAVWTSQPGASDAVVSYAATGLSSSAALSPDVTLSGAPVSSPEGVALGPDGRVWVANCSSNTVAAFPLGGGSAAVQLTGSAFACPRGLAFDTAGNLWVANGADAGVAECFAASKLSPNPVPTTPTADIRLAAPAPASQPSALALDAQGNVWVAFCGGSAVARYASSNGSVSTTPVATLTQTATQTGTSLDCPVALALDNSGELFVGNAGTAGAGGTLSWFAATDMATGGALPPQLQLPNIAFGVGGLAFNPTPANLPIRH